MFVHRPLTHLPTAAWLVCFVMAGCTANTVASGGQDTAPGTVTLHRLNHVEYNNTVHDLLGTAQTPANAFPPDAVANGFDNNADALTLDDGTLRLMETAAESLAAEAANPNGAALATIAPCSAESDPNACLSQFIARFGLRAWRRPLTHDEQAQMLAVALSGANEPYAQQVERAVMGFLVSPSFLFRVETDPNAASASAHALSGYELATRLSYFVWSTTPDNTLLDAAADGSLVTDSGLATQLSRMLADPRAAAIAQNFAGQWLELRTAAAFQADPTTFPNWDPNVRDLMVQQSQMTFTDVLQNGMPLNALFNGNTTYLNDRLATYYGLPAPGSQALTKVAIPEGPRRGLLGQGAILMSTSFPVRTSLVRRGEYITNQILCAPVPPPPANVPTLLPTSTGGSQRQRLEGHVTSPTCAACHNAMDPYGFVLEQFDAIGALRTLDNNVAIDTSAQLPTGQTVANVQGLQAALATDVRVPNCFVQKIASYALGRSLQTSDAATLAGWQQSFVSDDQQVDNLVRTIVMSPAFRQRQGGN